MFIAAAVLLDKALFYGVLPLGNYAAGEFYYWEASLAAARGCDPEALDSIRAALLHSRSEPQFWRRAAEISDRLQLPEAAYCWQQLDRLEPGSFAIQMHAAESALRIRDLDLASTILREVAPGDQSQPSFLCAAGQLAAACGDPAQARAVYSRLEAGPVLDATILLVLAHWHAAAQNQAELALAGRQFRSVLSRPDLACDARRGLVTLALRAGDPAGARKWSDEILKSHAFLFSDRVQRLDLLAGPERELAWRDLLASTRPDEIAALVAWMIAHGSAERALIWIREQPAEIQDDSRVARARAACLSALGMWDHLRDIQAADHWPGHESARLMYLARAQAELGFEANARAAWSQAVLACSEYPSYLELLDYLPQNQLKDVHSFWSAARVQVWSQMATRYPGQAWLARALLQDAVARRDSLRVEESWERLAAFDPADFEAAAAGAQVAILRGSRVEKNSALLQELRNENASDPVVLTASAYDLYRQGRFSEAMSLLGRLTPAELNAPQRAPYLGALLAVSGPIDRAQALLALAEAQPNLLEEERELIAHSRALLAYRQTMADLLSRGQGSITIEPGSALSALMRSVDLSRAGSVHDSAVLLAGIDPAQLDPAGRTIYLGAITALDGSVEDARPFLELSPDLLYRTAAETFHQAVAKWWNLQSRFPNDATMMAGLFIAYRGLDAQESSGVFWRQDAARELQLMRTALARGQQLPLVQERLRDLLRRLPSTPEAQADEAYVLMLLGQPHAARARLEMLARNDLAQPRPALYYGLILAACGEEHAAKTYFQCAARAPLLREELALMVAAEKRP